jgi:hypothetical protein
VGQLNEPLWVRVTVLGSVLACAAFGAVGLLLADVGEFELVPWFVLGLVAFVGLGLLARPLARAEGKVTEASNVGAIGAGVISLASMYWNGVNAAKPVQINRDGALYVNAGKWIAGHGTLDVRPYVAPFTKTAPFLASSTGMKPRGSHLEFSVSHMLPAILAEAQDIGGNRLMFLTVPILGGISLLVFYLLAARLLRQPFAALAATATLAFTMPQIMFSRDTSAEIPTQVLLFTALWLLCDRRTLRHRGTGFCVGILLGLLQAIHGDGVVFLLGLPALFAVLRLRAKHVDRRALRGGIVGCSTGIAVGLALAGFDLFRWNRSYLSILDANLERVAAAVALIMIASIAAARLHRRRPQLVSTLRRRRETASNVTFALVLAFGFGAWFVRPLVQKVHADPDASVALVQRLNKMPIDATRRYAELSVRWVSWYIGPITLILGIVGAAVLARRFVRGRLRAQPATTALLLAPPALVYLLFPSVTPDHVWAARRLLPAVFPGVILLGFALLCAAARDRDRPFLAERRFSVVVLAVMAAVYPLYTIHGVSQMTDQRGLFPVITDACTKLGRKSAVVILPERRKPRSSVYLSDPQTLRSFCEVPVVVMLRTVRPAQLQKLAAQWRAKGRVLMLVSEYPPTILRLFPRAQVQPTLVGQEPHLLERTLLRRPSRYRDRSRSTAATQLMIAAVPVAPRAPGPAG